MWGSGDAEQWKPQQRSVMGLDGVGEEEERIGFGCAVQRGQIGRVAEINPFFFCAI